MRRQCGTTPKITSKATALHRARLGVGVLAVAIALAVSAAVAPMGQLLLAGLVLVNQPDAALLLWQEPSTRPIWKQDAVPQPTVSPQPIARPTPAPAPEPTAAPTPIPAADLAPPPTAVPLPTDFPNGTLPIASEFFRQGSGDGYVSLSAGSIKNATDLSDAELQEAARGGLPFTIELNSSEPQVLILHTHATECYQPWDGAYYDPTFAARSQDPEENMCAVGERMAAVLNELGVNTLHDTTLHDSPSYTESYGRSAETAQNYLQRYPSIKVVLDVHRDALERNETRIKPLVSLENGEQAAQVMIICGCSNGNTIDLPHWRRNLQFAAAWESEAERCFPGLTRPVLCAYRNYNQNLSEGALLVEVGGHANTLDEALRGGEAAAKALASLFGAQAE